MFRKFLEESFGSFWNASGVSGMFRALLGCFGSVWNVSVVSRTFREFLDRFGSFWKVSVVSGMLRVFGRFREFLEGF